MASEDTRSAAKKEQNLMEKDGDVDGSEDERLKRQMSEATLYATEEEVEEEEEEDDEGKGVQGIDLGPRTSLKSEIEKDKDDESLRRWKEQLLGSVDLNSVGEILEPVVEILSLSIVSSGRPDIVLPVPVLPNHKRPWFTLKEGSHYKLKFSFIVRNNIVSGLKYTNTVRKAGINVDKAKEMLGTFSPQLEAYTFETSEEMIPSGLFVRGSYSARMKFVDDDGKCHLVINYSFDIRREWPSSS
ncbi:rho GDP-dissociation inhibitor 1-like [Curcuma longa]|uniref:rho GDP-dissociation inhibitor 1-like n=1 Tax=Curcuma longa TaxID=136217 RepID=UPI003D9F8B08